jgi:hypothetical protein
VCCNSKKFCKYNHENGYDGVVILKVVIVDITMLIFVIMVGNREKTNEKRGERAESTTDDRIYL